MANLEYRIGRLQINSELFRYEYPVAFFAKHKFVVEHAPSMLTLYVSQTKRHSYVTQVFPELADKHIVGGGSCYLDANEQLVMNDYSVRYGSVPTEIAQKFGELLMPKLQEQGIDPAGIIVNTDQAHINPFWRLYGYKNPEGQKKR
jgi:hypothetical protein